MSTLLRVLVVEDSDDDAHLLIRHLRKGDYSPACTRVQTADTMAEALAEQTWDLVLADNSMPGFDALSALEVLKMSGQDVPFIIVSGHIDDHSAVAAMRAGAHDYLLKDNLARLLPAIRRELDEAEVRAARRRAENELRYYAQHDPLTGLANRAEFERALDAALRSARMRGCTHVLCYLDLDQFKLVNDTCGHGAGDQMLRQLSVLLLEHLRSSDLLARLGGDEFGLLLEYCTTDTATAVLDKLRDVITQFRFAHEDRTFDVGVSIGLVPVTPESRCSSELLAAADVACHTAKELGRNRMHLYQPDDLQLRQRRREMQWASRITHAVDEDRLVLYCQPIHPVRSQSARAYQEILVRLRDEEGQLVLPGAFLPAAERYKLMPIIDRWVVETLFRHLGERRPDGLYFVNLSGATINDDSFLGFIEHRIRAYGVTPESLCFEITESVAIANLAQSLPFFGRLRDLGCAFALDDFGSGLSSFGYLKNLPVDFLKIDGSFVRNLAADTIDYTMVEAINRVGQAMQLRTIGEWVEEPGTLDLLAQIGVDYAQGFALARPAPLQTP